MPKSKEKTKVAKQVVEVSSPSSEGERTLIPEKPVFYESDSKEEDDPMATGPISPMTTSVELFVPSSGVRETTTALLDFGCSKCMVSMQTVEKVGHKFFLSWLSQLWSSQNGCQEGLFWIK